MSAGGLDSARPGVDGPTFLVAPLTSFGDDAMNPRFTWLVRCAAWVTFVCALQACPGPAPMTADAGADAGAPGIVSVRMRDNSQFLWLEAGSASLHAPAYSGMTTWDYVRLPESGYSGDVATDGGAAWEETTFLLVDGGVRVFHAAQVTRGPGAPLMRAWMNVDLRLCLRGSAAETARLDVRCSGDLRADGGGAATFAVGVGGLGSPRDDDADYCAAAAGLAPTVAPRWSAEASQRLLDGDACFSVVLSWAEEAGDEGAAGVREGEVLLTVTPSP